MVGTKNYGHVSKLVQDLNPEEALPLHAYTDSDWAGCEETRKSSSGEVIVLVGTVVETGSTTQPGVPATSSGEAEIRSLTHCAQSSVYVRNLACEDWTESGHSQGLVRFLRCVAGCQTHWHG